MAMPADGVQLTYVIVSYNRCHALLRTLGILHRDTPLPRWAWEVWVVDNGSSDGTVDAVAELFPDVHVLALPDNEGVWARTYAFARARGRYLVLLDDDSYPLGDAVPRSMGYLDAHPRTAAVVGRCVLPGGGDEGCAMPTVMLSGAVCLRKTAVDAVGGFRREFFRKAGEYDLSFRLWAAGHRVERFQDIVYEHDKVMTGRSSELAAFMDLRNNLILVDRYLPREARTVYRRDYLRRYALLAAHQGVGHIVGPAVTEARQFAAQERATGRAEVLDDATFEHLFEWQRQADLVGQWAREQGIARVAIHGYSKNLYATVRAARQHGLTITAIADDGPAFAGQTYRGIPVQPVAAAAQGVDGVILSNINPAQVEPGARQVAHHFTGPVLRLWSPTFMPAAPGATGLREAG